VYADLDTECLQPLDRILFKYACVLSSEPFEHASLIYNAEFLVTNSIMFCRAKHPFMKQVMDSLPGFSHFSQDIDSTGPNFLTYQYNKYMANLRKQHMNSNNKKISKLRFNKRGEGTETNDEMPLLLVDDLGDDYVFVPSTQYFQNGLDPVRYRQFKDMCLNYEQLNTIGKRGCVSLKFRGMKERKSLFEYTRHSFYHTGYKWIQESQLSVNDLVDKVIFYNHEK